MISIPSPLVEFMLLGPLEDRRQLQDSPILGDVWVRFGKDPANPTDLLISPHRDQHAGEVAQKIVDALIPDLEHAKALKHDPRIGVLQGLLVACLTFEQVIQFIVPKTKWWSQRWHEKDDLESPAAPENPDATPKVPVGKHDLQNYSPDRIKDGIATILKSVREWHETGTTTLSQELPALDRFIALTGLLLWARDHVLPGETPTPTMPSGPLPVVTTEPAGEGSTEGATEPAPDTAAPPPPEGASEAGAEQPSDIGAAPEGAESPPSEGDAPPPEESATQPPTEPAPEPTPPPAPEPVAAKPKTTMSVQEQITYILDNVKAEEIALSLDQLRNKMLGDVDADGWIEEPEVLIWQVSLNRQPVPALSRSVPAVKADAAHTLFKVNCSGIAWAVIDSGIDGNHPALRGRVKKSYDFKNYRKIVNVTNSNPFLRDQTLESLKADKSYWPTLQNPPNDQEAKDALQKLARDAAARGPIHWELVERFVEIKPGTPPRSNHGTHVAGIIGASRNAAIDDIKEKGGPGNADRAEKAARKRIADFADGMCPDIQLYDFRVLGRDIKDWEFAIIAALQFIRYLNDRHSFITIHGANLSLSIPHDIRNFACGRTPICNECERLIESGVVVVTAAGNHGYKSFETKEGSYESYAAFSITDPGNADGVITVGATHRFWPHTYGVSFFSSRGPTGDGRLKPDLVAPGEKIRAPVPTKSGNGIPGGEWEDLDGTSMAAPHVSGAAAMLMARYSEFIGQPRRIKRILCENATDLGRERSFQGHGMLDVLRAFQSI